MSNDQDSLNLKATLNLPFTEFPMKAGLAQREPEMLARWQKLDIYQRIADKNIGKTKFILHDGPPYANGELHLGHAINKSLKGNSSSNKNNKQKVKHHHHHHNNNNNNNNKEDSQRPKNQP